MIIYISILKLNLNIMATATQNDDLLILSDQDNITDTLVMDETTVIEENNNDSIDLISFDTELSEEAPVEVKNEENDINLDFWDSFSLTEDESLNITDDTSNDELNITESTDTLDFGSSIVEDTTEEPIIEEKEELNLWFSSWTTTEDESPNFNLEKVTATYISQLESRKEQISDSIKHNEDKISDREEKIKNLKSEITDFKVLNKDLDTENNEIDTRVWLVSWKSQTKDIKATTSTRIHNAKRKQAA